MFNSHFADGLNVNKEVIFSMQGLATWHCFPLMTARTGGYIVPCCLVK